MNKHDSEAQTYRAQLRRSAQTFKKKNKKSENDKNDENGGNSDSDSKLTRKQKRKLKCTHCKKYNHEQNICFELHSELKKNKKKNKKKNDSAELLNQTTVIANQIDYAFNVHCNLTIFNFEKCV